MTATQRIKEYAGLEVRLAARLAGSLTSVGVPHDVSERLRVGRDQAVARARQVRMAQQTRATGIAPSDAHAVVGLTRPGVATLGRRGADEGSGRWQDWLASALPLLLLVAGLMLISQWTAREQVLVAAEIDTLLLADDLPPAAYADPGFAEFLRSGSSR